MKNKLAPSMMCANLMDMKNVLRTFEQDNIEYLHVDIMDGVFVPNYTLGTYYCNILRENCAIPLDIHLMVERPEEKLRYFRICAGDIVSVHAESTAHIQRALSVIKKAGAKAFLALNPATPLCFLENVLEDIDGVLIMTVNPGYSGQKLIPQTIEKIRKTREMLDSCGFPETEIEVDGNVSFENAVKMKSAGANIFVAGSSGIFSKEFELSRGIELFRKLLN